MRWFAGAGSLAVLVAVVLGGGSPSPAGTADLAPGRALYASHCAACHGSGAKGDGASASAFATRPADLTDGRLLNPLPDEFLVRVIMDGGPAMGLAPTMPPFRGNLNEEQAGQIVAFLQNEDLVPAPPTQSVGEV